MRHWPFSVIKNSPLAPPQFAWELYRYPQTRTISEAACEAVALIAHDTQAMETPHMELVLGTDHPPGLVYLRRPAALEFALLEAQGVVFHAEQYYLFSLSYQ